MPAMCDASACCAAASALLLMAVLLSFISAVRPAGGACARADGGGAGYFISAAPPTPGKRRGRSASSAAGACRTVSMPSGAPRPSDAGSAGDLLGIRGRESPSALPTLGRIIIRAAPEMAWPKVALVDCRIRSAFVRRHADGGLAESSTWPAA